MNNSILIKGPKIYSEKGIFNGSLFIEDGIIKEIRDIDSKESVSYCKHVLEFDSSFYLIPGMIDIHTHGALGYDCMDASFEALKGICDILPHEGTTSYLPTTITEDDEKIEAAITNISEFIKNYNFYGAEILGINLEGPFISPEKCGAHDPKKIKKPYIKLFNKWQKCCNDLIQIVTIAPELESSFEFINYLKTNNIIVSIGHTMASYDVTMKAIEAGCNLATHLFNAMSGLDHRSPGAAAAVLLSDNIFAEIIVDGIHVHKDMINFAYRLKGSDKIVLVTDAIRAKYLDDGIYELGGQQVFVKEGVAKLWDGTLAGSLLKMKNAFKNMHDFCNLNIEELIKITSTNQAKLLNIYNRKGSIAEGKDADVVVLDDTLDVVLTVCRGRIVYGI